MKLPKPKFKTRRQRILLIYAPCILLGLMLLVAGIGKLPGLSDILGKFPGQTEFISDLLGPLWTSTTAFFIDNILPWIEVVLGIALLLGIFPRIAAILSLPLTAGFMSSNIWAISHGEAFGHCGCFGIFEDLFGNITPLQALGMDIALLFFALLIILFNPSGFLKFQWWFTKRKELEGESK
jgi:uncharacterized membrane protein YphA (DoxX/SURF4 family)